MKIDAVEQAQRAVRDGDVSSAELDAHQAELAEVRGLAERLERLGRRAGQEARLAGPRALLDEIVLDALAAEAQELADGILALEAASDLAEIAAQLERVRFLVLTLTRVRS